MLLEPTWTATSAKERVLHRIITLDETCARSYQPELKWQSNEWRHYGSPRRSNILQNPNNVKMMVIFVYDCHGVILKHTFSTTAGNQCAVKLLIFGAPS
ncbi:histone-lysine N-methyltransferase SETMAR [Trichonephila clavata]|uniref:Histone-lysine N-methyltransferase SETMAR n=1 Tax=Trichonephila clavata TaxID=2740835 RepID=A0A8X6LRB1_TRICU|nr:histone-lysine N-methyltransferase SETMAR [Trichonephila clavata]